MKSEDSIKFFIIPCYIYKYKKLDSALLWRGNFYANLAFFIGQLPTFLKSYVYKYLMHALLFPEVFSEKKKDKI